MIRHTGRLRRPVCPRSDRYDRSRCWSPAPTAWAPSCSWPSCWTSTTPWASTAWPCASTTSSAAAPSPCFSWTTWPCGKNVPEQRRSHRLRRGRGLRPGRLRSHRRRDRRACPASMAADDYDLAGFSVGMVDKAEHHRTAAAMAGGRCADRLCPPPASTPTATLWSARYSTWRTPIWAGMMTELG